MRFNKPNMKRMKVINVAGGEAYRESDKLALVGILLTSFLQDQFYRSGQKTYNDLVELIHKVDPLFAAKAAIFARNEFGMRTVSHVTAAELAQIVKGQRWTKKFFERVVYRPDDMLEIIAYTFSKFGRYIPTAMKKGFRNAIIQFDGYQLAKYKKEKADVSMYDLINLIHPYRTEAIDALMKGTLGAAETWEKKLTQAGQEAETEEQKSQLKTQSWKTLLRERRLGYFALLRNLRNILEQAPNMVPKALVQLRNPKAIRNSKILPFRYMIAFEEIAKTGNPMARDILVALDEAATLACNNVPNFPGKTLIALDISRSMTNNYVSGKSQARAIDIAALFAAVLYKALDADLIAFEYDAQYVVANPNKPVLTLTSRLNHAPGGDTNFRAIFHRATRPYDRVIILSDMQGWVGYKSPVDVFHRYCKEYNCKPHIYSINLCDYGTLMFPENMVYCLSGWSEKIFDLMKYLEQDRNALIRKIEKIDLSICK